MLRDALVVGVNHYQYLPSLKAPARDAEAIAQQLHTFGEFRVHRLPEVIQSGKPSIGQKTKVSLRELEAALINLFKPKGNSVPHTAVFYFSGHGIQRDAGIQEGYLALSDSNPDQGFYGLSLFWLRRLLQESPVRQRIIWLDCCHSGELLNFLEADPGARPGTDRLFMAASREYETAYESLESEYSVFTDALLTGLDPRRVASGVITNHSLTDWVNHTLKGEIQQPLFESSGSEIILTRTVPGQSPLSDSPVAASQDICPYRGLEFFDETHAEYFFGREDLTAQLLKKLIQSHFIAVSGASGSGKSSLIRAGLIAQLKQVRCSGSEWKIRLITPTDHPLKSLAAAFIDPELSDLERAEQLRRAETFLQDGAAGLAQLVRASLPTTVLSQQRSRFLLVVDQFEEVFTLSQGPQAERERQEFFDCLLGALEMAEDILSVVIVLRSDFSNKCFLYESLAQRILQDQVTVVPLKYEQIKATIVRPAQKVGLVCEPNLVYTMMSDVIGAPGELPLLQYTLSELWNRRCNAGEAAHLTLDAYQALGGVRGTLQKRATEVFHSLTPEEQTVARRIFLALTQLGEGTEDTRRRVAKSELIAPAFPAELVNRVLEKLIAAKLVVTSQASASNQNQPHEDNNQRLTSGLPSEWAGVLPNSQEIVDVAHEALIRNWSLLRSWLDENRDMLRRQRRIEQAAQEWNQVGQPATGEYLLHGLRLRDAEDFLRLYPQELSALGQQFIHVSCAECRRTRRESRQLQLAIPAVLVASLTVVLGQYYGAMRTQAEKENQLQKATARERAAIAQAVVQDAKADPMTALLLGRLAVEDHDTGYEAEVSLRAALQNLRLQLELKGHKGAVRQVAFSPNRQYLGTAGSDGTIRLWNLSPQTIYSTNPRAEKVLAWSNSDQAGKTAAIQMMSFSPSGQQLAAIAEGSPIVKIWSISSDTVVHQLAGTVAVKQLVFSPTGEWIATLDAAQNISIWDSETGSLRVRLQSGIINSIQFSPNGKSLLSANEDGTMQIWQIATNAGSMAVHPLKTFSQPGAVEQAAFSPSGRWITTLGKDGSVRLWDSQTGKLERVLSDQTKAALPPMQQIVFSPDEQILATLDANQQVWLWNPVSGQLQSKLDHQEQLQNASSTISTNSSGMLQFSSDSRMVAMTAATPNASGFYTVSLWNSRTGQQISQLPGHQQPITSIQFNPDNTYIVTASADGTVRLWATEGGGELPSVHLAEGEVEWATFLSSSTALPGSTSEPNNLRSTQAQPVEKLPYTNEVTQLSGWNAPNGSSFATIKRLFHWSGWSDWLNPRQAQFSRNQIVQQQNHQAMDRADASTTTAPNRGVTTMLAIAANGKLQRWQIVGDSAPDSGTFANLSARTANDITLVSSNPMAAIRSDATTSLREKLLALVQSHFGHSSFGYSRSGGVPPVLPGFAQLLELPFLRSGAELTTSTNLLETMGLPRFDATVSSFALSSDGGQLATADLEGWITVYQIQADQTFRVSHRFRSGLLVDRDHAANGKPTSLSEPNANRQVDQNNNLAQNNQLKQRSEPVAIRHLIFSPDGQQLLGIADDFTMRSWNSRSGEQIAVFRGHTAAIRQARYSPDSQFIVSASWDRTARIWQAATGQSVKVLPEQSPVSSASFSPDGSRVATASWDGAVQVWRASTGKPQFSLEQQKAALDIQFSPDGRSLLTASVDGIARLWNAATGEEQAILQPNRAGSEAIVQASFSPDGQYVVTLTQSGQINLWAATRSMLLKLARERSLRQLTPEECNRYLKLSPEQCPRLAS
jgi:WD40 repeat protein